MEYLRHLKHAVCWQRREGSVGGNFDISYYCSGMRNMQCFENHEREFFLFCAYFRQRPNHLRVVVGHGRSHTHLRTPLRQLVQRVGHPFASDRPEDHHERRCDILCVI